MLRRSLALLLLLTALAAGCQKPQSDGKLSESDAKAAANDIVELVHGAKAGDPSSVNISYEPKTKFGKDFKAVFQKSIAINNDYKAVTDKIDLLKVLAPDRLASAQGIAQSKKDLETLKTSTTKFYDENGKVVVELVDLTSKAMGSTPDGAALILQETRKMAEQATTVWEAAGKVIAIAENGHPKKTDHNTLVFMKDADVIAYNKAVEELQKVSAENEEYVAKVMAERQQRISAGISKLNEIK